MPKAKPKSDRTRVRRRAGRGRYGRATIDAILDEGFVGHAAFAIDGQPYVLPMLYARAGDHVYLHGSPLSRLIGTAAAGVPLCFAVTLIDGLVLARSAFHHSVNYRSVTLFGTGRPLADAGEREAALTALVEHVVPGRTADARGPSAAELAATEVIALPIDEASAKVRSGPPVDTPEDYAIPVWAGELPLRLLAGAPVADDRCGVPTPGYIRDYRRDRD